MSGTFDLLAYSVGVPVTAESLIQGYYRYQNCNPSIIQAFREVNQHRRQHPTAVSLPEELLEEIEGFLKAKADRYAHNRLKRLKKPWAKGDTTIAHLVNVTISKFLKKAFAVASTPGRHVFEHEKALSHIVLYLPSKVRAITLHPSWRKVPRNKVEEQALVRHTHNNKMLWAMFLETSPQRDPNLVITSEETLTVNKAIKDLELEVFLMPDPLAEESDSEADHDSQDSDYANPGWKRARWPSTETDEHGKLWSLDEISISRFKNRELLHRSS